MTSYDRRPRAGTIPVPRCGHLAGHESGDPLMVHALVNRCGSVGRSVLLAQPTEGFESLAHPLSVHAGTVPSGRRPERSTSLAAEVHEDPPKVIRDLLDPVVLGLDFFLVQEEQDPLLSTPPTPCPG